METIVSLAEAARLRGVSIRRKTQQTKEGGNLQGDPKNQIYTPEERLAYETIFRSQLEQAEDFPRRAMTISLLVELELDRVGPKGKGAEFKDEEGLF